MPDEEWAPAAQRYAVDTSGSSPRFGRVTRCAGGTVFLHPPGGGAEWAASPEKLRQPTEEEWERIRIVTTPVRGVVTGDRTYPGAVPVVLSADYGIRPRPEPTDGCTPCAYLVQWFDHYMRRGPQHDESAAVDCVVEIRNHPHDPPKMSIREFAPSTAKRPGKGEAL